MVILYCQMENFGKWLLEQLELRQMTQIDLANRSGVTPAQISRVINGVRGVGNDTLLKIAGALQISPETIFRAAGLLPEKKELDPKVERINHLANQLLDEEDKEELIKILELKLERQGRERGSDTNARTRYERTPKQLLAAAEKRKS